MRHCLHCDSQYNVSLRDCSNCGATPTNIDGFDAYAPEFSYESDGFKASYFTDLSLLEASNFWFRGRNKIIHWALKKYATGFNNFLEIGCGTGFVLSNIGDKFPGVNLYGSEIFTDGLGIAAKRLPSANFLQMDALRIPFINEFDAMGAFDVLEHIKEDDIALEQIYKALKPDGLLFITVPQHAWLWSATDEYALHQRRYEATDIHEKLIRTGFKIIRSSSFVTTLLPLMVVSRVLQKRRTEKFDPAAELKINPALNYIFEKLLRIELAGIELGINYPVGGSRLIVAKKL